MLNRRRKLCSAGRPSGWALAHILVVSYISYIYNCISSRSFYNSIFQCFNPGSPILCISRISIYIRQIGRIQGAKGKNRRCLAASLSTSGLGSAVGESVAVSGCPSGLSNSNIKCSLYSTGTFYFQFSSVQMFKNPR